MPRLLIIIRGGCIELVAVEGMPEGVTLEMVQIDYDTDGDDEGGGCLRVDGDLAYVHVGTLGTMSPADAAIARMARDTFNLVED